jgi:hypothetical protein
MVVFWIVMLATLFGGWFAPLNPNYQRGYNGVLWLLLAILGAYAIGLPGLPGK